MAFPPEVQYGGEKQRRLKIELGSPVADWCQNLITPFQKEGVGGIVYFANNMRILTGPLPLQPQLWQLVFCDGEYQPIGAIMLSVELGKKAIAEFPSQNLNQILEIMGQIKKYQPEEALFAFDRYASEKEIRSLQEQCGQILGSNYQAYLFCVDNFSHALSLQPAYQNIEINKTDIGFSLIIWNETRTGPHQKAQDIALLFLISPVEKLSNLKAIYAIEEDGPFNINPVFIEPGKPLSWSIVKGYLEKYSYRQLDHLGFVKLKRLLEGSWLVGSQNAEELNPKAREFLNTTSLPPKPDH